MPVGRILCVANQKGGVGKTTTALNLAAGLARGGLRTLLVDLDPQCNATTGLGATPAATHPLVSQSPLSESVMETLIPGLWILPGSRSVRDVERIATQARSGSMVLESHLAGGLNAWDYCLIDCPPSVGELTRTALAGSTEVLMPIQCEYFALEGLTQMIEVIRDVMEEQSGRLRFSGIVLTMHDDSLELTAEVEAEVRDFFGETIMKKFFNKWGPQELEPWPSDIYEQVDINKTIMKRHISITLSTKQDMFQHYDIIKDNKTCFSNFSTYVRDGKTISYWNEHNEYITKTL